MPFTPAHVAITLPWRRASRRWVDLTGLAIGSLAPDFEYFLRWAVAAPIGHSRTVSHSVGAILYFNLPLVFLLAYLWHGVVRRPLLCHLPRPLDAWLARQAQARWRLGSVREVLVFAGSAVAGISSHIFLDAFTHYRGAFVLLWPALATRVTVLGRELRVYQVLQHGMSVVGLAVVAWLVLAAGAELRAARPQAGGVGAARKLVYWGLVVLFALGAVGQRLVLLRRIESRLVGLYVISLISGALIGVLVASVVCRRAVPGPDRAGEVPPGPS